MELTSPASGSGGVKPQLNPLWFLYSFFFGFVFLLSFASGWFKIMNKKKIYKKKNYGNIMNFFCTYVMLRLYISSMGGRLMFERC